MIKIKVSYENEKELSSFISLIKNNIEKIKRPKNNEGKYKKVYITLK